MKLYSQNYCTNLNRLVINLKIEVIFSNDFTVIHNKQTMASVEVLYGVSMIEQGVSRVVPVDFRTLAESA